MSSLKSLPLEEIVLPLTLGNFAPTDGGGLISDLLRPESLTMFGMLLVGGKVTDSELACDCDVRRRFVPLR